MKYTPFSEITGQKVTRKKEVENWVVKSNVTRNESALWIARFRQRTKESFLHIGILVASVLSDSPQFGDILYQ